MGTTGLDAKASNFSIRFVNTELNQNGWRGFHVLGTNKSVVNVDFSASNGTSFASNTEDGIYLYEMSDTTVVLDHGATVANNQGNVMFLSEMSDTTIVLDH